MNFEAATNYSGLKVLMIEKNYTRVVIVFSTRTTL